MQEAVFEIRGGGEYAAATAGVDCHAELWCNDHADLIVVRGGDPDPFLDRVRAVGGIDESIRGDGEVVAVTRDCLTEHEQTVDPHLAERGCLLLGPIRYADGAKHCRVLALDPEALSAAYRDLSAAFSVTVRRTRSVDTVEAPHAPGLSDPPALTGRQREALRLAREMGYYELPRETTTEAIARRLGVGRRTAEEHLRRAEQKVIDAFARRQFP